MLTPDKAPGNLLLATSLVKSPAYHSNSKPTTPGPDPVSPVAVADPVPASHEVLGFTAVATASGVPVRSSISTTKGRDLQPVLLSCATTVYSPGGMPLYVGPVKSSVALTLGPSYHKNVTSSGDVAVAEPVLRLAHDVTSTLELRAIVGKIFGDTNDTCWVTSQPLCKSVIT